MMADGEVIGVLEVGFIGDENAVDDTRQLLENAAEAMGMALRSSQYRSRMVDLLEETQRQSEELQVQQEELRVSNEELEERGRVLMETQARLETQQAELEQTNVHLEEYTQHLERQKTELVRAQRNWRRTRWRLRARASTSPNSSRTCRTSCARRSTVR